MGMIVTPDPHANGSPYEKGSKKSRRHIVRGEQRGSVAATWGEEIERTNPKRADQYVTQNHPPKGPASPKESPPAAPPPEEPQANAGESRSSPPDRAGP